MSNKCKICSGFKEFGNIVCNKCYDAYINDRYNDDVHDSPGRGDLINEIRDYYEQKLIIFKKKIEDWF